jgi:hypothetical protein
VIERMNSLIRRRTACHRFVEVCTRRYEVIVFVAFASVAGVFDAAGAEEKTTVLHFIEAEPSKYFTDEVTGGFKKAQFLRFKYVLPGAMEGLVDRTDADVKWSFSVTENCHGWCLKTRSTIHQSLLTARRIDRKCPLPYELALDFLDSNERTIETFAFSAGGVCFHFRNAYYAVAPSERIGKSLADVPFAEIFSLK